MPGDINTHRGLSPWAFIFILILHVEFSHTLGIRFINPSGGATLPAGITDISWQDSGSSPGLSNLTTYALDLIVGGNRISQDATVIQTLVTEEFAASGHARVNISSDTAQSIQNGFYLRMTSNVTDGRTVINYSGRFTLVAMTGTTDAVYINGSQTTVGDSNVPSDQLNVPVPVQASSSSDGLSTVSTAPSSIASAAVPSNSLASNGASSSDLNTGTIAAVAVCGVAAGVIMMVLGWWCWSLRRRKMLRKAKRSLDANYNYDGKAELPASKASSPVEVGSTVSRAQTTAELAEQRFPVNALEMESHDNTPVEAGAHDSIYELESDWKGWEMSSTKRDTVAYDPTR